jgi:hypothetical protein
MMEEIIRQEQTFLLVIEQVIVLVDRRRTYCVLNHTSSIITLSLFEKRMAQGDSRESKPSEARLTKSLAENEIKVS